LAELGREAESPAAAARVLALIEERLAARPGDGELVRVRALTQTATGQWDHAAVELARFFAGATDRSPQWFQTGWWVVGPFPHNPRELDAHYPPEDQSDPFRPVADAQGKGTLSWRAAVADARGFLDLGKLFPSADRVSAYALSRIYSPVEQDAVLVV